MEFYQEIYLSGGKANGKGRISVLQRGQRAAVFISVDNFQHDYQPLHGFLFSYMFRRSLARCMEWRMEGSIRLWSSTDGVLRIKSGVSRRGIMFFTASKAEWDRMGWTTFKAMDGINVRLQPSYYYYTATD
jgi:hypothetical protein